MKKAQNKNKRIVFILKRFEEIKFTNICCGDPYRSTQIDSRIPLFFRGMILRDKD